jgi:predicted 3-demethylubiquinone-9 3-methyltransferase (glyoxalase superfamily)
MQKIVPFLWFDNNLEEAMNFYTSVFKNAEITKVVRQGKVGPLPEGSVITASFTLEGQEFTGLNGGPAFTFNESISFYVKCDTQEEIDHYWNSLTLNGGEESNCGWLKDKFGLSWQITPPILIKMIGDPDREKADRAMAAMMKMKKIIIKDLEEAFNG